jgi:DegT/DnrJ/EryC1/StrS aminotransferase family
MHLELEEDLEAAFGRVLRSGWYLLGSELEEFEREFAAYCGTATASASPPASARSSSRIIRWREAASVACNSRQKVSCLLLTA